MSLKGSSFLLASSPEGRVLTAALIPTGDPRKKGNAAISLLAEAMGTLLVLLLTFAP